MAKKYDRHPGCMWGIFHVLHFHPWHGIKEMLPHKRHGGRRHTVSGGIKYWGLKNFPATGEAQEFIDTEMDESLIENKMSETSLASNKSAEPHMKGLTLEEMSKPEVHKPMLFLRTDSIHHLEPSHPDLPDEVREDAGTPRINLHHDDANTPATCTCDPILAMPLGESVASHKCCKLCDTTSTLKKSDNGQFIELGRHALLRGKSDKEKEDLIQKKSVDAKDVHNNFACCQSKEFLDALEIFNVNKELFQKILKDPNYALAHHFQGLQAANANRGLTKSGTYPAPDLSGRKNFSLNKLNYKQKEIGFFTRHEGKLQAGKPPSMLTTDLSSVDNTAQSMLLTAGNNSGSILKPGQGSLELGETGNNLDSSPGASQELKKQGENRVVMKRFKDLKKRIKRAIKESRKEGHQIFMDAILHKIPYGRRFSKDAKREMTGQWKESEVDRGGNGSQRSGYVSDVSVSTLGKRGPHRIRRTPSLNESLDRYSRLFESSFSREEKWHLSDRLRLKNEGVSQFGRAPKSWGRILSLPDIESYCFLQSETSGDAVCLGKPTRVLVESNKSIESCTSNGQKPSLPNNSTENFTQLGASKESGNQEDLVEEGASSPFDRDQIGLLLDGNHDGNATLGETSADLNNLANGERSSISQCEPVPTNNSSSKLAQLSPLSVLDSCFEDNITSPAKFTISEGSELNPRRIDLDDLDLVVNLPEQFIMDSPSGAEITMDLEDIKNPSNYSNSEILHLQVNRKDAADFSYVRDVLKLSGFIENEFLGTWYSPDWPLDPSLFDEVEACSFQLDYVVDERGSSFDHQLLFDITNEVLLEIYRRSFPYWPRPLSCNCRIRPMPIGYHVLEEVWTSISWYLRSQPELEPSLDYAVSQDLSKCDEWMNLQFDSECMGLELEQMILDDLLEEVICSC